MTWPVFTGGTNPICESDKLAEGLRMEAFGHIIRGYFQMWERKWWGGAREPKKSTLFSFSLCQNTAVLLYSFLSLCQNYFWLQRRKCLLCGLVHWSHAVFPPSKSAVLSPKWFAYFPCNTSLKKVREEIKRRGGATAIISGFTCSQLLGRFKAGCVTTTPPTSSITVSVSSKPIMAVMIRGVSLSGGVLEV